MKISDEDKIFRSMITKDEEHDFQFSSKTKATIAANLETIRTNVKHQIFLNHTWRNLIPRLCWMICPELIWKNDELVTDEWSLNHKFYQTLSI